MFRESIPREHICRRLFQLRQSPGQALQVLTLLKTCNICSQVLTLLKTCNIMFRELIPREHICRRLFQLRQSPGQALQVLALLETCNIMFRESIPKEQICRRLFQLSLERFLPPPLFDLLSNCVFPVVYKAQYLDNILEECASSVKNVRYPFNAKRSVG